MYGWYSFLLFPFSLLYGLVVRVRNLMYDLGWLRSHDFPVPIISVGNITVGGTGKTPHIEYLIRLLSPRYRVGVLSRGYGRRTRGFRWVEVQSAFSEAGDEPCQIKRKFPEVMVAVDERRVHGVHRLLSQALAPQVILLDDAFQHRSLKPGLSLLLVDARRTLAGDCLLPTGRLREPVSGVARADVVVVTKMPDGATDAEKGRTLASCCVPEGKSFCFSTLRYADPYVLQGMSSLEGDPAHTGVLLVSGIARPELFVRWARDHYREVAECLYPDHYPFTLRDIDGISDKFASMREPKIILTTEKDAVRLRDILPQPLRNRCFVLPVEVAFLPGQGPSFDSLVLQFVESFHE
jgi:tetraacyldisaccharide 4'-kinase